MRKRQKPAADILKLSDAEMRLLVLGAALYRTNIAGSKIIADVLDERHGTKPAAIKPAKRRRKK